MPRRAWPALYYTALLCPTLPGTHKWAGWLHNPCSLEDPHRFTAGGKIKGGPQVGRVIAVLGMAMQGSAGQGMTVKCRAGQGSEVQGTALPCPDPLHAPLQPFPACLPNVPLSMQSCYAYWTCISRCRAPFPPASASMTSVGCARRPRATPTAGWRPATPTTTR